MNPPYDATGITHLRYARELGETMRDHAVPESRAVWLRLSEGHQEIFAQWPERIIRQESGRVSLLNRSGETVSTGGSELLWQEIRATPDSPTPDTDCPYKGGWIGLIGYDQADTTAKAGSHPAFPDVLLGDYRRFLFMDHQRQIAEIVTLPGYSGPLDDPSVQPENREPGHIAPPFQLQQGFVALTPKSRYLADFARIQAYLQAGDCYQVNYAQAFHARCEGSGAEAMRRLLKLTKATHAAWMQSPEGEVFSLSPEMFLSIRGGYARTKPIKGTMPRGETPRQDADNHDSLASSIKNRAENLMIVDLLRHDLGRHAVTGSVKVEKLFEIESLPQVHHMVSTISARLSDKADAADMIRDCFPGGSITGAPKKRAMEIIAELEPTRRSVYCGCIGFIGGNGDVELNIAIRTLLRTGNDLYAWAGGGIVADSEAEAEYQECFDKIGAIMRALENLQEVGR